MRSPGADLVVGLVVVAVAGGGAVVLARQDLPAPPPHVVATVPTDPPVVPGRVISLDGSGDPAFTFLPLPTPHGDRKVSAQLAFNALAQDASKYTPMPASVRAYYGRLTDPDASPMAVDTPAWGFATVGGCLVVGGASTDGAAAPTPRRPYRCRQWEFVDALTGHDLGVVEQEVLPG